MVVNLSVENCKRLTEDAYIFSPWTVDDINGVLNKYASELQKSIVVDRTNGKTYSAIASKNDFSCAHIRTQYRKVLILLNNAEKCNWYKDEHISVDSPIYVLNLPVRTYNPLARNKIKDLGTLASYTRKQLLRLRGLGEVGVSQIEEALARHDIHLRTEVQNIN